MKYILILLVYIAIPFQILICQETSSYTETLVPSEFSIRFKNTDEKNSFKLLREFLKEKEALLESLKEQLITIKENEFGDQIDTTDNAAYRSQIQQLSKLIKKGMNDDEKVKVPELLLHNPNISGIYKNRYKDSLNILTVAEINDAIDNKEKKIDDVIKKYKKINILETNIKNVTNDITKCTNQIDSALAPEYQQQDFRKTISISFSILIGLLLAIFFFIVYKRSDHTLSKDLLSGNGLQFITLFVLIIAVILFGILNILGSSELAAILSGISGYILGKGTQKDLSTILTASTMNQPTGTNQQSGINQSAGSTTTQ